METLDKQLVKLQKHAERRCQKSIKPGLNFYGLVKLWHDECRPTKLLFAGRRGAATMAAISLALLSAVAFLTQGNY